MGEQACMGEKASNTGKAKIGCGFIVTGAILGAVACVLMFLADPPRGHSAGGWVMIVPLSVLFAAAGAVLVMAIVAAATLFRSRRVWSSIAFLVLFVSCCGLVPLFMFGPRSARRFVSGLTGADADVVGLWALAVGAVLVIVVWIVSTVLPARRRRSLAARREDVD